MKRFLYYPILKKYKDYFVITKVVYEIRPYKESVHWDNEYDDAKYIVK